MKTFLTKIIIPILFFIISFNITIKNSSAQENTKIQNNMYFFWGATCQHCKKAMPFVDEIEKNNQNLKIIRMETWENKENSKFFQELAKDRGVKGRGVPAFFIGDNPPIFGFSENAKSKIKKYVKNCAYKGCINPNDKKIEQNPDVPLENKQIKPCDAEDADICEVNESENIDLDALMMSINPEESLNPDDNVISAPIIGEVDLNHSSLWLATAIIAFVDGLNPCSLWVIMFLLGIVIHSGSRAKIALVSGVFLLVTASVYGLFMLGMLNVFIYVGYIKWIHITIGILAMLFAMVNIKDYFIFKEGISFTIGDEQKSGIFKNIRNVMKKDNSIFGIIIGTIVLSLGVSLAELPCTAGFPVIWTNLIAHKEVNMGLFAMLFALYLLIYLLDELAVIITAIVTLKMGKFEEKHGRILKLLGGSVMMALAMAMLFAPDKLNDLQATLGIFLLAIIITGLIIFVHKVVMPKLKKGK